MEIGFNVTYLLDALGALAANWPSCLSPTPPAVA
jgi:DNA polymerase III sliding clamp (beta) subunit (PCNA family)